MGRQGTGSPEGGRATVAIAQVVSERDPEANLERAARFTEQAADSGARMIVFPEYFMSWGPGRHGREEMPTVAQPLTGAFVGGLRELAQRRKIWIVAGIFEASEGEGERPFNTILVVDGAGEIVQSYRKTHLFDAFKHRESEIFEPGDALNEPFPSPIGMAGIFVCYELRFPEVARSLAMGGAEILIVPSAWVAGPLKDMHWGTLVRARALENGCYVIAAAQTGNEFCGQSMVVDPMGVPVARAGVEETLLLAAVSRERVAEVREIVPSIFNRRPSLYRPTA